MAHPIRPCDVCGTPYEPYYWGEKRKTRTCSKPCMTKLNASESYAVKAAERAAVRASLRCPQCGDRIETTRSDKRFCSKSCRYLSEKKPRPTYQRTCAECGDPFVTRYSLAEMCGQRCRRNRHLRLNPGVKRLYEVRRNGWLSTGRIDPRDWERLCRRYDGCAYCPSEGPVTMDHVVPLSRGGTHTIGNVLPACSPCNTRKSAKLLIEWKVDRWPTLSAAAASTSGRTRTSGNIGRAVRG